MPYLAEYPARLVYADVVIANGETASGEIDLHGCTLCGFFVPDEFTGTAVTFTAAPGAGGTHAPVVDADGADVTRTVAAGDYVPVDPADFAGVRWLKLVSGSAEGAARTITIAARPV